MTVAAVGFEKGEIMGFGKGRGRREGLLALLFAVVGGVLLRGGREESGGVLLADPVAPSPATAHDGARDPETRGSRETLPGTARPLQLGAVAAPAVTLEKTEV